MLPFFWTNMNLPFFGSKCMNFRIFCGNLPLFWDKLYECSSFFGQIVWITLFLDKMCEFSHLCENLPPFWDKMYECSAFLDNLCKFSPFFGQNVWILTFFRQTDPFLGYKTMIFEDNIPLSNVGGFLLWGWFLLWNTPPHQIKFSLLKMRLQYQVLFRLFWPIINSCFYPKGCHKGWRPPAPPALKVDICLLRTPLS